MYARDLSEPKYEFLIKKREDAGIKHFNDPKAKFDYSPLSKFFNRGLKEEEEKRRTFEETKKILRIKMKSSWMKLHIKAKNN